MILGTASYMSPEQAKGKPVDQRADIYAFGAVLYEMLTGTRLHRGETTTEILASVIREEPPWDNVPLRVRRLLRKCLEKDPQKRLRHIGDVMALLDDASATPISTPPVLARKRSVKLAWVALACVLSAAAAGSAAWFFKPAAVSRTVTRFSILLPPGQHLDAGGPALAMSPDGSRFVYVAAQGNSSGSILQDVGGTQLYLRAIDSLDARPIPGTEGARDPFFSPDGQWIGFFVSGALKKISISGGPPVSLAEYSPGQNSAAAVAIGGASWYRGSIVFGEAGGPIQQVADTGGSAHALTRLNAGELGNYFPEFLPDGRGVLFDVETGANITASVTTGDRHDLNLSGFLPRYAASGHIIYLQGANLMAAPFNLRNLSLTGAALPVVEGVQSLQYSFSSSGSLVYAPGGAQAPQLKPVWVDRKGMEQLLPAPAHNYVFPRISPDGRRIAADIEEVESQIWVYEIGRDTLSRLTFEKSNNFDPVWSPDGKRIIFKGAGNRLYWMPSDGSGTAEALTTSALSLNDVPIAWSPDGQLLAFTEDSANRNRSIWTLSIKDRKAQPFGQSLRRDSAPQFSPDGHWIAYDSNESGRDEIYVRPFPGPGGKYQISAGGGTEPVWNPKGHELFYRNRGKMMAVEVTAQPAFSAGERKTLFEGPYVISPRSAADYDVSPDGQRFLMLKSADAAPRPEQINVVLNWFEELKQRVPSGTK
jgi:Tol biopolymer transport system component